MVCLLASGKLDMCQAVLLIRVLSAPFIIQFLLFTLMIMLSKKKKNILL